MRFSLQLSSDEVHVIRPSARNVQSDTAVVMEISDRETAAQPTGVLLHLIGQDRDIVARVMNPDVKKLSEGQIIDVKLFSKGQRL